MPRQGEYIRAKEGNEPSCLINHLSSRKQHADVHTNWEIGGFLTVRTLPDGDLIVNSRFRTATMGFSSPCTVLLDIAVKVQGGVRADGKELRAPGCH